MKKEISPLLIVLTLLVLVGGVLGAFAYFASPHTPPGVNYTPGVPPWKEKGGANYKPTPDYPPAGSNPGGSQTSPARAPSVDGGK